MAQDSLQGCVVPSVAASVFRIVVASLIGGGIAMAAADVCLAQQKKADKADDEKTQLNKALNLAAAIGKLDQVKDLLKKGADFHGEECAMTV